MAAEPRGRAETPAIEARGLTRRFGTLVAVDHVDLSIPRAGIYGFLGPNGSGKSTTIRMLCGLLEPTSGSVRVLGHEMPREAEQMRAKLGYMTQKFSLWDDLTVRENLQFMAQIHGLRNAAREARIAELATEFELDPLLGQRAGTMSGGQRQRLALAAATLHRPELLLLDEPTSAVDPRSRRDFWESLFVLVGARHDHSRLHSLHGRGGALPPTRDPRPRAARRRGCTQGPDVRHSGHRARDRGGGRHRRAPCACTRSRP